MKSESPTSLSMFPNIQGLTINHKLNHIELNPHQVRTTHFIQAILPETKILFKVYPWGAKLLPSKTFNLSSQ